MHTLYAEKNKGEFILSDGFYKETVERYCHIMGKNMKFNRYTSGENRCFECFHREECEKNGGCRHHIFSAVNSCKDTNQ